MCVYGVCDASGDETRMGASILVSDMGGADMCDTVVLLCVVTCVVTCVCVTVVGVVCVVYV